MILAVSLDYFVLPLALLLVFGIAALLNAASRSKRSQWLPDKKPWICFLPKYCMNLQLTGPMENWEAEVHERITRLGFEIASDNDDFRSYKRGSAYADFNAAKIRTLIVVQRPVTNPAVIGLQYASKLGVAFDTGDLWTVADAIRSELSSERHG